MSAVIAPPNAWSEIKTVRSCAKQLGIDPQKAARQYVDSGYSKSYVSHIAEAARRARMGGNNTATLENGHE